MVLLHRVETDIKSRRSLTAAPVLQPAGGQWLPDVKELAGGSDEWQQAGDPPLRITWDQVCCWNARIQFSLLT